MPKLNLLDFGALSSAACNITGRAILCNRLKVSSKSTVGRVVQHKFAKQEI